MTVTTDLTVVDRDTGELIDLRTALTKNLAALSVRCAELRQDLADTEAAISDELVRRLDRDASWTYRPPAMSGDAIQYEITAPTPTAGTKGYDPTLMEAELRALLERDTLSETAAAEVLRRHVEIVARVPFGSDLDAIVKQLRGAAGFDIAGVPCEVVSVDAKRQVMAGGVTKILKVPGTKAAVERATISTRAPSRKAKITVKTKAGA